MMDNDTMMNACVDAVGAVVEKREDVLAFVIAVLDADANCLVISRAGIEDMANRLDGAHGAIAQTIGEAFVATEDELIALFEKETAKP